MLHKHDRWIFSLIVATGLSPPALADSLSAGADQVDRSSYSAEDICTAVRGVRLYLDQHRQNILAHARVEIADQTAAEAKTIFGEDEIDDPHVGDLTAKVAEQRLVQLQGKLQTTATRLRDAYAAGCLTTRSGRRGSAGDALAAMAEPHVELAAVRRDVGELSQYAPAEFKTPVFQCVGDFETCRGAIGDEFGCGITFMICIGQQLIPLTSN